MRDFYFSFPPSESKNYKFPFIERILHLLHILDEKHLEIEQVFEGNLPFGQFSAEEQAELHIALECISFMNEIPGGFFLYYADGDEELIYANRGILRMFLCDTIKEFRELTGNSFKGIVHPDDLTAVEDSIHRQILTSQYDTDYVEYRILRKDGSVRWVDDYGHLVRSESMRDIFFVFLGKPSERRTQQQMQALTEAYEKANLASKAKNVFLSQISHEMRTPLNAIFGFTTLAQTSLNEPKVIADYLEQIETASHQLLNMITQALDVTALSGAVNSTDEECDLCAIFQEVYDSLLSQAKERNHTFTLNCRKINHRYVYATSKWLRQLVFNLAHNAIVYTAPGGTVDIILTEEKTLPDNINICVYQLVVRDNGIGMDESYLEHIYEPFSRESTSTFNGIPGIGLGLSIVKTIVNLLGGSISVDSTLKKGTSFTVTFPLQAKIEIPKQPEPLPLRILLVEDNDLNREIETELLERKGFIVDPVAEGRTAFEKIKHASPTDYNLILMDLMMPDMDGWQAATAIRSLPDPALAHIPIIALSANVRIEDRRKSLESGIDVHLSKPMDLPLLLETIEKITAKPNV